MTIERSQDPAQRHYLTAYSLWALAEHRAAETPDALCAVDEHGYRMTFAELLSRSERAAAGLWDLGVRPQQTIVWQLPTWIDTLVLMTALARLDTVQVPLPNIYRSREVDYIVTATSADWYIACARWGTTDYTEYVDAIKLASPTTSTLLLRQHEFPEADEPIEYRHQLDLEAVRWIYHTSGTTALPKGALHTDGGLLSAAAQYVEVAQFTSADRLALVFPVAHVGGLIVHAVALLAGSANILVERFDPAETVRVLAREGVTLPGAAQAFHLVYLDAQAAHGSEPIFPNAREYPSGGAPKSPDLHSRLVREMGHGLLPNYGLTESPMSTGCPVGATDDQRANTEGRANPGMELRVMNDRGQEVPAGEDGELHIRGPQLFLGYVDSILDTDAFTDDGWFRTGDLAKLDPEGYLYIVGRLKDVIIRKGENISAKEVEDLLFQHPSVREIAVIGIPDPEVGERCCAVIATPDDIEPADPEELAQWLRDQGLMIQKIPERWYFVDAIPRGETGKALKVELRRRFS